MTKDEIMNEITTIKHNVPAIQEANAIGSAASEDGGFEALLKFKKGEYSLSGEVVPLGTRYIAHCIGWTRCWIKFEKQQVVERRMYRVADGKQPPDRSELDCLDKSTWPFGPTNQPSDPWVYQYLLPMENEETGDICIFVTSSIGGKRGVSDLCKGYSRRVARTGIAAQPIVQLAMAKMPTKMYGDVPRPAFDIVGWTGAEAEAIRDIKPQSIREEINDDIPF
jgi:hypothetical protein